jgi:RNA polymerase sigma-70 factor (ECF subfamily)
MNALDTVMDRHAAALMRFVRVIVEDDAASEQVLRDTFLAAGRVAAEFNGDGSARAFLLNLARGIAYRRSRPGEASDDEEDLATLGIGAGWGAEGAAEPPTAEGKARVSMGLRNLSADDRAVIILRDLEGLSAVGAAELLGIEEERVKDRLHRARLRLVAALAGGPP